MTRANGSHDTMLAAFERPEMAHDAMRALVSAGVPTRDVRLLNEGPQGSRRAEIEADDREIRWLASRTKYGALIGALVGAVIGLVVALIVEPDVEIAIGATVGGAVAGAFVGGLLGAFVGLARDPDAWDTYVRAHEDETCVAVMAGPRADRVEALLREAGAASVERA